MVGQTHITQTLQNAIRSDKLAQAMLFCGPRGVGKTTCARILAKAVNCQQRTEEAEACGQCISCRSIRDGGSLAIHELDAASNNSVDDIRSLVEQVRYPPQGGKFKVYIIDEVHMLSTAAFNAFLKTLEEPPPYAIFILATTEKHKILPTILSRCQVFHFNRIRVPDIAGELARVCKADGIPYEEQALFALAEKSDGALRDALSMLDQIVGFSGGQLRTRDVVANLNLLDSRLFFEATEYIRAGNLTDLLLLLQKIIVDGFETDAFLAGLASHWRLLLLAHDERTQDLLEVGKDGLPEYVQQSGALSLDILLSGLNLLAQAELNHRQSRNPRLHAEMALAKLCYARLLLAPPDSDVPDSTEDNGIPATRPQTGAVAATSPSPNIQGEATPVNPPARPNVSAMQFSPSSPVLSNPDPSRVNTGNLPVGGEVRGNEFQVPDTRTTALAADGGIQFTGSTGTDKQATALAAEGGIQFTGSTGTDNQATAPASEGGIHFPASTGTDTRTTALAADGGIQYTGSTGTDIRTTASAAGGGIQFPASTGSAYRSPDASAGVAMGSIQGISHTPAADMKAGGAPGNPTDAGSGHPDTYYPAQKFEETPLTRGNGVENKAVAATGSTHPPQAGSHPSAATGTSSPLKISRIKSPQIPNPTEVKTNENTDGQTSVEGNQPQVEFLPLDRAWQRLLAELLANGRQHAHSILAQIKPVLNQGYEIEISLASEALRNSLEPLLFDLTTQLRLWTGNAQILLKLIFAEPDAGSGSVLTFAEKKQWLIDKYPNINGFVKKIGLDWSY